MGEHTQRAFLQLGARAQEAGKYSRESLQRFVEGNESRSRGEYAPLYRDTYETTDFDEAHVPGTSSEHGSASSGRRSPPNEKGGKGGWEKW